ncbi:MAG: DUF5674 family protein [Candidatus Taylorbacteria bacterium]|nr:DUF5674 family protein [Candidatus Taylorbacteria bacterium]
MSDLHIIEEPITKEELKKIAEERFGDLVKGAVDIEQGIMVLGGEFHMDESHFLYEQRQSKSDNVWGINLYPDKSGDDMIEYDSVINLKPGLGNRTRGVDSQEIKEKIKKVVKKLILE